MEKELHISNFLNPINFFSIMNSVIALIFYTYYSMVFLSLHTLAIELLADEVPEWNWSSETTWMRLKFADLAERLVYCTKNA